MIAVGRERRERHSPADTQRACDNGGYIDCSRSRFLCLDCLVSPLNTHRRTHKGHCRVPLATPTKTSSVEYYYRFLLLRHYSRSRLPNHLFASLSLCQLFTRHHHLSIGLSQVPTSPRLPPLKFKLVITSVPYRWDFAGRDAEGGGGGRRGWANRCLHAGSCQQSRNVLAMSAGSPRFSLSLHLLLVRLSEKDFHGCPHSSADGADAGYRLAGGT